MERAHLESLLAEGLSLAEIGRRVGRHEATVGYWVRKHGLVPVGRGRHASRGGIDRDRLDALVGAGMSIAQIAERTARSKSTVRHWLMRYGMRTHGAAGRRKGGESEAAREAGLDTALMTCRYHGKTEFARDCQGYFRCKRCRAASVSRRRRRVKGCS